MTKVPKRHTPNFLTYFKHWITNTPNEGINGKIQAFKLMVCGYRSRETYKKAVYFHRVRLTPYPPPAGA